MKSIAVTLLVCFLVAFAAADKPSIKLDVFHQSNTWWMAVAVRDADVDTRAIQIKQADASSWETMEFTHGWGYYTVYARGTPFKFPFSVRLTAVNGKEITLNNAITTFAAGVINTHMNYDGGVAPSTSAPTTKPTAAATQAATAAPTQAVTAAPTQAATKAPTAAATQAATKAPTAAPQATKAPTKAPTAAATTRPTAAQTTKPTTKPTAAATTKPTSAPTTRPTAAATTKPTTAPTTKATVKPTTAPSSGCNAPLKMLVPLYMYPGTQWDTVIASSSKVETVAIINPSSGPGSSGPSNSFKTYMAKFDQAGIEMIGYVHTSYGERSISDVKKEIDEYATKFDSVVGIFLDEVSAKDAQLPYYKELHTYIMNMPGWKYNVINPGAVPASGYADAATQIVSFETASSKFASSSNPSYASCSNKDKFSVITYGASASGMRSVVDAARSKGYYGWVYVTEDSYTKLPSFYADMAQYIADGN